MPKTRPPYPPEFRQEAVPLARESGKPKADIARELGVAGETLRIWPLKPELAGGRDLLADVRGWNSHRFVRDRARLA